TCKAFRQVLNTPLVISRCLITRAIDDLSRFSAATTAAATTATTATATTATATAIKDPHPFVFIIRRHRVITYNVLALILAYVKAHVPRRIPRYQLQFATRFFKQLDRPELLAHVFVYARENYAEFSIAPNKADDKLLEQYVSDDDRLEDVRRIFRDGGMDANFQQLTSLSCHLNQNAATHLWVQSLVSRNFDTLHHLVSIGMDPLHNETAENTTNIADVLMQTSIPTFMEQRIDVVVFAVIQGTFFQTGMSDAQLDTYGFFVRKQAKHTFLMLKLCRRLAGHLRLNNPYSQSVKAIL
ncbi:hypothetical protein HK102_003341, partial [Quaeritorhiza haematococci]